MGDRKAPRPAPRNQRKPDPPPAPPPRVTSLEVVSTVGLAKCTITLPDGGRCPLCGAELAPRRTHRCEQRNIPLSSIGALLSKIFGGGL